jgi:sugar phosphate isomerase/epimerase
MISISFMTANYVARPLGYHMTEGWMQGDSANQDHFRPLATFKERFNTYLSDVRTMGFDRLDIWLAILHPSWATAEHISIAKDLLRQHGLPVVSLAGGFGGTRAEFQKTCELAVALGTTVLGGGTPLLAGDRAFVVDTLKRHGLKLAIENHPEKTPEELLAKIGDGGGGTIGAAIDTGWFGTQGYDSAQAIERLNGYLFHIHLKDVLEPGKHDTCRYGRGCVPLERCVQTLKRLGYQGAISVEHEPESYDPTEDCIASLGLLKGWLGHG